MEQSNDAILKEREMKELLGIYYDSRDSDILHAPTILNLKFEAKLRDGGYNGIHYHNTNGGSTDFIQLGKATNQFFFIPEEKIDAVTTYRAEGKVYSANGDFIVNQYSTQSMGISSLLRQFLNSTTQTSIPMTVECEVTFTRTPNEAARAKYCDILRRNKTPEQYAIYLASAKHSQNYRQSKYAMFEGDLRQAIYNHDKRQTIYLIELLFGKKINKTANQREVFNVLANQPFSTFGIYDVKKLDSMLDILRKHSMKEVTDQLLSLGIKPATDLSRWSEYKQLTITTL